MPRVPDLDLNRKMTRMDGQERAKAGTGVQGKMQALRRFARDTNAPAWQKNQAQQKQKQSHRNFQNWQNRGKGVQGKMQQLRGFARSQGVRPGQAGKPAQQAPQGQKQGITAEPGSAEWTRQAARLRGQTEQQGQMQKMMQSGRPSMGGAQPYQITGEGSRSEGYTDENGQFHYGRPTQEQLTAYQNRPRFGVGAKQIPQMGVGGGQQGGGFGQQMAGGGYQMPSMGGGGQQNPYALNVGAFQPPQQPYQSNVQNTFNPGAYQSNFNPAQTFNPYASIGAQGNIGAQRGAALARMGSSSPNFQQGMGYMNQGAQQPWDRAGQIAANQAGGLNNYNAYVNSPTAFSGQMGSLAQQGGWGGQQQGGFPQGGFPNAQGLMGGYGGQSGYQGQQGGGYGGQQGGYGGLQGAVMNAVGATGNQGGGQQGPTEYDRQLGISQDLANFQNAQSSTMNERRLQAGPFNSGLSGLLGNQYNPYGNINPVYAAGGFARMDPTIKRGHYDTRSGHNTQTGMQTMGNWA